MLFYATQKYFGLTSWGIATYYMDDVEITEVPMVTVNFVAPGQRSPGRRLRRHDQGAGRQLQHYGN